MSGESPSVLVRREGEIAVLTLNRPEKRNAIDLAMVQQLHQSLDELALDQGLAALVLCGAGEKAFAGGADIGELKERGHLEALRGINSSLFRKVEEFPVPTIAAVQGYALGGGCELALACDLRVAGESAKFGQPEVSLGIIPGAGALYRLPRLVGLGRAKELVFTARIIDAREAERVGLVNRVVPDARVLEESLALAREIAGQGRLAVRLAKTVFHAVARQQGDAAAAMESVAQAVLFESEDKHRRMGAALEKRKAKERAKGDARNA